LSRSIEPKGGGLAKLRETLKEQEVERVQGFTSQEIPDGEGGCTTKRAACIPGGGQYKKQMRSTTRQSFTR